jgi:DNA (cytosine-5)-methyltransferase 1
MGKWSVAWRVLDAQFWGVPQRRRRIALVADFGGQSASEILFIRKSVSGDIEPGKPKGKEVTGDVGESSGGAVKAVGFPLGFRPENVRLYDELATTLCNGTRPGFTTGVVQDQTIFQPVAYGIGSYHSNGWKSNNPESGVYEANTSKTLDSLNCGYPGCNQGGMAIVQPILDDQGGSQITVRYDGKCPTLRAEMHGNVPIVMEPAYCIGNGQVDQLGLSEKVGTLNCMHDQQAVLIPAVAHTLRAKASGGFSLNCNQVVRVKHIVRRLTPLECERLQGYPDGWTDIGEWVDSKGKKHKEADSPRYKALGNSIAIPPWKWVLKRLCACYDRDATMASLFDGIGGFPYIWEQLNGKGSCLWASEIEEFPMAVTKIRFGGNMNEDQT